MRRLVAFTAFAVPALAVIGYAMVAWLIREFDDAIGGVHFADIEEDWDDYDNYYLQALLR